MEWRRLHTAPWATSFKSSARVAKQEILHGAAAAEFLDEDVAFQAIHQAAALYDRTAPGRIVPHDQGDSEEALVAHRGDLGRGAVDGHTLDRNDRIDGKIGISKPCIRLTQDRARRHFHGMKGVTYTIHFGGGKRP